MTEQSRARALLLDTSWSELTHAYGTAEETQHHLVNLVSDDPEERMFAVDHLWGAVLHQGSVFSVTPYVARVVAAMLPNDHLTMQVSSIFGDALYPPRQTRAELLRFLGTLASNVRDSEEVHATACRALAPELVAATSVWVGDSDASVAEAAIFASAGLARLLEQTEVRTQISRLLEEVASDRTAESARRAMCVLGLDILEIDTRPYLSAEQRVVRVCAALGAWAADDDQALNEVLTALEALPESDHWLDPQNPFVGGWLRFRLIAAAADRVDNFDILAPAAMAVVRMASTYTVDNDLKPLMDKAFSEPESWIAPLSASQRSFLRAMVVNDELWDPGFVSVEAVLKSHRLPTTRGGLRQLVELSGDA